jgi:anti-sigma factor RsiW
MTEDMACIELVELVTDHFELQLDDPQRRRLEAHLAACGGCRAYVEQMRTTIELTGSLEPDDVPAPVLDAVTELFRERHRR